MKLKDTLYKWCYGKCKDCVWRYNGGCSEWPNTNI